MRKIVYKERFENELMNIIEFIAQRDGILRAENLYHQIYDKIETIPFMPYRFRQNLDANDKNIRDLIYKGYKIPFRVNDNDIEILGIYKENLWVQE
ncbi:MAG: type II toxin-antitoxin system RelE/ParE family toxin [Neisseriaceae bacterium]|nr:type II toxin-antitoxin system RelE/ParE family toxin [Neisseriaceae bacterium]